MKTIDPRNVVRGVIERNPDRDSAAAELVTLVVTDDDLHAAIIAEYQPNLLIDLCRAAVQRESAKARREAWRVVATDSDNRQLISRAAAIAAQLAVWTLPLRGGLKLQDATREQVAEALGYTQAQMSGLRANAAFYRALVQELAPGQVVRDIPQERQAELLEASR